jgi:NDP-sugar pyrophosphorylase family protein
MTETALVILAAGMGSRYGGLKQAENIDGRGNALMDYSVYDARAVGFSRVILIIRKETEDVFRERIKGWRGTSVDFAFQETDRFTEGMIKKRVKPWGTGHAIACLDGVVSSPFAVINADDFYGRSAIENIYRFLIDKAENGRYATVGYRLENTISKNGKVSRGIMKADGGFLKRITETSGIIGENGKINSDNGYLPSDALVSMNLWGFAPDIIGECKRRFSTFIKENIYKDIDECEFFLPNVVSDLIDEGIAEVSLLQTDERWLGITYREDTLAVANALSKMTAMGIYP